MTRVTRWSLRAGLVLAVWMAVPTNTAWPYVRYRSKRGNPYSWRSHVVSIQAYPRELPEMPLPQVEVAMSQSVSAWTREDPGVAMCSDLSLPVFTATDGAEAPPAGYDQHNTIAIRTTNWEEICTAAPDGEPVCHQREQLAVTTLFATSSGVILDADIEVNAWDFEWGDLDTMASRDLQDLQNALTHEMGHFIGLDHTCYNNLAELQPDDQGRPIIPPNNTGMPSPECFLATTDELDATMFPSADPGDVTKRTLEVDDRRGVCAIYPLDDGGGCGPCAVGASPTGRGGGPRGGPAGRLTLALALAMLVTAARRRPGSIRPVRVKAKWKYPLPRQATPSRHRCQIRRCLSGRIRGHAATSWPFAPPCARELSWHTACCKLIR